MTRLFILLVGSVSLGLFSCGTTSQTTTEVKPNTATPASVAETELPNILSIGIKMEKKDKENYLVELGYLKRPEGKVKDDYPLFVDKIEPNRLLCSFLNANNQILKQALIPNPLSREVEYVDEDGTLKTKIVEQKKGEFLLRTQDNSGYKVIQIDVIDGNKNTQPLKTIAL